MNDNPYRAPKDLDANTANPRLLIWTLGTVFGAAFVGGVLGLIVGGALGWFLPNYYRSVFDRGDALNFDPLAVGLGLGLTQGITLGTVVGLILVAMFYWFRSRQPMNQK